MDDACCPFCLQVVAQVALVNRETRVQKGGSTIKYIPLIASVSEAIRWACQATDPKERPPLDSLPVKFVRLSIVEADEKTVGTSTLWLGFQMLPVHQVMSSTSTLGVALDVDDGRRQCMWEDCKKMEEEGGKAFKRCGSCHAPFLTSPVMGNNTVRAHAGKGYLQQH